MPERGAKGHREPDKHKKPAEYSLPNPDAGIPDMVNFRISSAKEEIANRPDTPADIQEIIKDLYRRVADYPRDSEAKANLLLYEHRLGVDARRGIELGIKNPDGTKSVVRIKGLIELHQELGEAEVNRTLDDIIRVRFSPVIDPVLDEHFAEAGRRAIAQRQ